MVTFTSFSLLLLLFSAKTVHAKIYIYIFIKYCNVSVKYSQTKADSLWPDAASLASTLAPGFNFTLAKCLCSSESVNKKTRGEELHTDGSLAELGQIVILLQSSNFSTYLGFSLPFG